MEERTEAGIRGSLPGRLVPAVAFVVVASAVAILAVGVSCASDTDDLIGKVMEGDLEAISGMIDGGVDVNGKNEDGTPPLVLAASYRGYEDVVELLVAKGADVNVTEDAGRTPLMSAASVSKKGTEFLLSKGADIKARSEGGATAFHHCFMGHLEGEDLTAVGEILLSAGADVDEAMEQGTTALMIAAQTGELEAVKFLVSRGAKPGVVRESDGKTALALARESGHEQVVEFLKQKEAD